jgi:flavin reductase (DIM6/NTAB) family NADH-FMN oxidoreductase RutF
LPTSGAARAHLAPFSYFNGVTSAPPMRVFSVGDFMAGRLKDTHRNLRRDPQCVAHIARSTQARAVQDRAAGLPWGVSEIDHAGLELTDWDWPLPRLARVGRGGYASLGPVLRPRQR